MDTLPPPSNPTPGERVSRFDLYLSVLDARDYAQRHMDLAIILWSKAIEVMIWGHPVVFDAYVGADWLNG
jgi:hypothetical protein